MNTNKILFLLSYLLILPLIPIFPQSNNQVTQQRFPRTYHITYTVFATKNTLSFNNPGTYIQVLGIPTPVTNKYQKVTNLTYDKGKLVSFPDKKEMYIRVESSEPIKKVTVEYDITMYDTITNFTKITDINNYNKSSRIYRDNTGYYNQSIDPAHPKIIAIADDVWNDSLDILDYAKKVYIRIQDTLKWTTSGNYSGLTNIFKNGGGDCGALSSVLISLLRNKGIPARYVTGWIIKDQNTQSNHVWTEFYLEGYGWIPADPAYFGGEANFYFGHVDGDRIILHRGLDFKFDNGKSVSTITAYQKYFFAHWLWGGSVSGSFKLDQTVTPFLKSSPQYSNYYNNDGYISQTISKLYSLINKERKKNNLTALSQSSTLNNAAQKAVTSQYSSNPLSSKDALSSVGYSASYYIARWYRFTCISNDTEKPVINSQREYLLNDKISEIGIGYYFDADKQNHNYYLLLTSPR